MPGAAHPHAQAQEFPTSANNQLWLPTEVEPGQPLPPDPIANTENCPFKNGTPPAIDTSETVPAGQTTPPPLPVPDKPVGGDQLGACGTVAAAGFTVPERLSIGSWLIFDIDSGDVIAAKDPHGRYRPASIIKVLIALQAIKELPLDRTLTGTQEAANIDGSRAGIGPDGKYTVEQVLQGLVMSSGNDCAKMLADALGGDEKTLSKLQNLADSLGATDTRITSYSGLDAAGLQTSAYDLALFYREAFNNKVFRKLVATKQVDFPGYQDKPGFAISNDNEMLYNYDGAIGGKTGFTNDARHTYAGAAERHGRKLAVIELNASNAAGRGWQQATTLLDAAWPVTGRVGALVGSPAAKKVDINSPSGTSLPTTVQTQTAAAGNAEGKNELRHNTGPVKIAVSVAIIAIIVGACAWTFRRYRTKHLG